MADTSSSRPARRRFAPHVRASLALGSIAVASLGLTACDSPPPSPPQLQDARFTTVSECVNAGFPDRLCEAGYSAAWQNYQETAPKFTTNQSCEEEWGAGKCVTLTPEPAQVASASSGSVFVPMLAGFMVSQALQQRYREGGGAIYGGGVGYGAPIYRDRSGTPVQIDPPSTADTKAIPRPVNMNTTSVARSGFGGSSSGRSSGG